MKFFTFAFGLLFLLLSNAVSAGLVSWPSQTFSQSRYVSASEGPNIRFSILKPEMSIMKIDHVNFTPENARPGDELTIEVVGYLFETIYEFTTVEVAIFAGSEDPTIKKYNLCDELRDNREHVPFQCPIKEGPISFYQIVKLKETIPEDKIYISVKVFNGDRRLLTHFSINADFTPDSNKYLELIN